MEFAEARPALDLTRHHFKRELRDITIYGTWLHNPDQEDEEPCIVLLPSFRRIGVKPCVIALSAAFRYSDPRYLAHVAARFTRDMGFEQTMANAHRIANLIFDHLGDLLSMPHDPKQTIVVGEGVIHHPDGQRQTVELLDYEQIPQSH